MKSRIKNIINKKHSFDHFITIYIIVGCIEIFIRYFFVPSSFSLLFPTLILSMFLSINNHHVNIRSFWYLLIPFIGYTLLFLFLFFNYSYADALYIWSPIFNIGYSLIALIYMAPLFLKALSFNFSLFITRKSTVLFLLFLLTTIYALGNLTLMHFILPLIATDKNAIYTFSDSFWIEWFLLLISMFIVVLYFFYGRKKQKEYSYPTIKELEEYKKEIINVLNIKQSYLQPDFTMNALAIETGIEKRNLAYFFDYYIHKDFVQLIAEYRIGYALKLMQQDGVSYTLEAIANECGYRSRASFNKYFQQITGLLPSQYIALLKK